MSGAEPTPMDAPTHGYTVPNAAWQPPASTPPPHLPPLAGWGRRLLARLIDYVILWPVMVGMWAGLVEIAGRLVPEGEDPPAPILIAFCLGTVGIPMLVEWLQLVTRGHTVGKALLGLRVVPVAPGVAKLPKDRAAARAFFFPGLAYVVPCSAAWLLIVSLVTFTNKPLRQGLHDQVGRSVVVTAR